MRQRQRPRAIAALIAILFALGTCLPASSQDLRELEKRFFEVNKVVEDPLTDEAGIRKALRELEILARVTQEFEEADLQPQDPRAALAGSIIQTLRGVEARLPAGFGQQRLDLRPGFPVPEFHGRELLAKQAATLDQSQQRLAAHLRRTGDLGDPTSAELLHEVSVTLEALAWEAGWPFTREESDAFRKADGLTEAAYLSRLQRGVERIKKQISQEHDANGRAVSQDFVLHVATDNEGKERFAEHLEKLRRVAPIDHELFRQFDKEQAEILKGNPNQPR